MNDLLQGVITVVLIPFFIMLAIVVNTLASKGTSLIQFPDQEIIIENETASNNTTAMNNASNNTEKVIINNYGFNILHNNKGLDCITILFQIQYFL